MFGLPVQHFWRPKRGMPSVAEKDFLRQLKSVFSSSMGASHPSVISFYACCELPVDSNPGVMTFLAVMALSPVVTVKEKSDSGAFAKHFMSLRR